MITKHPDGKCIIETTIPDWENLLYLIGLGIGTLPKNSVRNALALLNRINMGNPDWEPYNLDNWETQVAERWSLKSETNKTD